MTTYVYNNLPAFAVLPFNTSTDVLDFSESEITSFAQIQIGDNDGPGEVSFFTDKRAIFLQLDDPLRFTDANFILPGGGKFLIGDNAGTVKDDDLANTLTGSAFADLLGGLGGNDSIDAGDGNDLIEMFSGDSDNIGADTINGGAGFDLIDFRDLEHSGYPSSLNANLAAGSYVIVSAVGIDSMGNPTSFSTMTGAIVAGTVEAVIGGDANDTLTGNASGNYFNGGGGNDNISGADGNDSLFGNFGNDSIDGGNGDDLIRGGFGRDTAIGGAGNDTFWYFGGGDQITDSGGTDTALAQNGASIETFTGVENLTLVSNVGLNATTATLNRFFLGDFNGDTNPAFFLVPELAGNTASNVLTGNTKVNFFLPGQGNDTVIGAGGFDIVQYDAPDISPGVPSPFAAISALSVTFDTLGGGSVTGSGLGTDSLVGISGVITGQAADSVDGGAGNFDQLVAGGMGNDTLKGGDGNDTILGGKGNDSLDGGAGNNDLVAYFDAESGISASLSTAFGDGQDRDPVTAGFQFGTDSLVGFENIAGGIYEDLITGNSGANRIFGGAGSDFLTGGAGNDTIDGGPDRGFVFPFPTAVPTDAFGRGDAASYAGNATAVNASLATGTASDGTYTDTLVNIELLEGSLFNDTLVGGNSSHLLRGSALTDPFEGFRGGSGNDLIDGGDHNGIDPDDGYYDFVDYIKSPAGINVNLATGIATDGYGSTDTLVNIDAVHGSNFADTLVGGSSSTNLAGDPFESFFGAGGNDSIDGGAGIDRVEFGGLNPLVPFVLGVIVNLGADSIQVGGDTIQAGQTRDGFDTDTLTGGLQAGIDTLVGIEWVSGSLFDDTLRGGSGNESFEGMSGTDSIDGGGGTDTAIYELSSNGVVVNLSDQLVNVRPHWSSITIGVSAHTALDGFDSQSNTAGIQSFVDSLTNFERAIGSDYSDYFVGNANQNNYFDGGGGVRQGDQPFSHSDTVDYGQNSHVGPITLVGGNVTHDTSLNDTLFGIEQVIGTDSADSMQGTDTSPDVQGLITDRSERYRGGLGNDTIDGGSSKWGDNDQADFSSASSGVTIDLQNGTASGSAGNDVLLNIDNVTGSNFNDYLFGGSDSRNYGGAMQEVFRGGAGSDTIYGNDGFNIAEYTSATTGVIANLGDFGSGFANDGQGGTDQLWNITGLRGGNFNDNFTGSDNGQRETYEGNAGDDFIDGSGGEDVASYRASPNAVFVDLGHAFALDGWGTVDTLADIEGAQGSDFDDTLIGGNTASADDAEGWQVFEGRAGNDLIDGADEYVLGVPGITDNDLDFAEYRNSVGAVVVNLVTGTAQDGYGGTDSLIGIEGAVGSRYNDTLIGGNTSSTSMLFEGFNGRAGDDSFVGGVGEDWVDYYEGQEGVVVNLATGTATDGWDSNFDDSDGVQAGTDSFTGIEHVLGSAFNDVIIGSSAGNFLHGDDGEDQISGGGGDDTIDGGDQNGLNHDDGFDFADYATTANAVTVDLGSSQALAGADGNDILSRIEGAFGSGFNDTLIGDQDDNAFAGGAGNDSIDGGAGNDWAIYDPASGDVVVDLDAQTATGADGNDTLQSIENARGGDFNDTLIGTAGDNGFYGGLGNDSIVSGGGIDTLTYQGASGSVHIDLVNNVATGAGDDTLFGSFGTVEGSEFADTIIGATLSGGQYQFLEGGYGADSIVGGNTSDGGLSILSFKDTDYFVNFDFSASPTGSGTLDTSDGTITYSGIEGVAGAGFGDFLKGNAADNYFEGGDGADTIDGGIGADWISYRDAINPVVVNIGSGTVNLSNGYVTASGDNIGPQTIFGGQSFETDADDDFFSNSWRDSLSGVENIEGGAHNDTLVGLFNQTNVLVGGGGNDQLRGGGGVAGDSFVGGAGSDLVDFSGTTATSGTGVNVNLGTGIATKSGFAIDAMQSIEQANGTIYNDTMTGSLQTYTGIQHDLVFELFAGGAGNDSLVGDGTDGQYNIANYGGTSAAVVVNLGANSASGGAGTDTLINIDDALGSNFNDTLTGGSASKGFSGQLFESFRGQGGNDSIDGLGGEDRVDYRFSTGAVNVNLATGTAIDGQGGTDTIKNVENVRGSVFSDVLTGGSTQNSGTIYDYEAFEGMEGNDTINGGVGFDIASYSNDDTGVVVDLQNGFALDGYGTRDTLLNIEQLIGSDYDDQLKGSDNLTDREAFRGGAGNDTIDGGAGNDGAFYNASPNAVVVDLDAGTAQDGYGNTDTLINIEGARGSIFNDTLLGGDGNESFEGIQGNDFIDGGDGNDRIDFHRDQGAVTVDLGAGTASGSFSGTDTFANIEAVRGTLLFNDSLVGGSGNETIEGSGGNDTMDGGAGNDVLSFRNALAAINVALTGAPQTIITVAGTDSITGFEGLQGGDFNDTLTSGAGIETLIGGLGNDSYSVNSTADTIVEAANEGTDTVTALIGGGSYALTGAVENLILTGTASVGGTGNASNNAITGNSGNNTIDGGAGSDTLTGGGGNDTYFVDRGSDQIVEVAGAGIDTVILSAGFNPSAFIPPHGASADIDPPVITFTLAANLENATVSGPDLKANLIATGTTANFLVGGLFGDSINAAGGNDTLDGLGGLDTMVGGAGDDLYFVKQIGDKVDESIGGGAGKDTVISSVTIYGLTFGVENLTLANDPNPGDPTILIGRGNDLPNYVKGNNVNNQLFGGGGNDTLEGGGGNDRLYGGAGSDSYLIDGGDTIIEVGGSAADNAKVKNSVDLRTSVGIEGASAEGGRYGIDITGNKQGNKIQGNETNNKLDGGKGGGADTLDGGLGNDTYVINNAAIDKIIDTGGGGDAIETDFNMSLVPFTTVENLLFVGSTNAIGVGNALVNFLRGNDGHNLLSGMDADDDLQGGLGNDTLDGGKGNDRLYGGDGNDTYVIDSAGDLVFESVRVEAVSVAAGVFGNGASATNLLPPATVISGDGRYVQFLSSASNLIASDGNVTVDAFVKDMLTGAVVRVNVGTPGTPVSTDVLHSSINPGGRFVAFTTTTSLVGTGDINGVADVYIRDWNPTAPLTPSTKLLSVATTGNAGNGASIMSDISSDGRFVAISSAATNLVADDTNSQTDIFLVDRLLNTLVRVSLADDEAEANGAAGNGVSISANGNFVAFTSTADNLVADDDNSQVDIFVRDVAGLTTDRVSVNSGEIEADAASANPRISLDGRYVVFQSSATNLVVGDTNAASDIFVRDRQDGTTVRVSTDSMGGEANGASTIGSISGDGRYVVFQSDADDLVAGDTPATMDVFIKDLVTGDIARLSAGLASATAPDISEDGRYIVFTTSAVLAGDGNAATDVVRIANPLLMGQGGIDTIKSPFSITLTSEFENLVLLGTTATIGTGTNADNLLDGSLNTAANTLNGALGNDIYIVGAGDVINDTGGTDGVLSTVTFSLAGLPQIENLTLVAKDTVAVNGTGNDGDNYIKGNGAINSLTGGLGADTLEGGAGNDIYITDGLDTVTELANGGTDTVQSPATVDLTVVLNVENVLLLGGAHVNAIGNGLGNLLTGNTGNNVLNGGLGNDTMIGAAGNDSYFVDNAKDVVTETGTDTGDSVSSSISYVLGATIEHLALTGADPLAGTGNAAGNSITGNSGNNILDGKAGNDSMAGGDGADLYFVDAAGDVVTESGTDGAIDEVRSTATFDGSGSGLLERIVLLGSTAIHAIGNALNNFLLGNTGANTLTGGLGNDTLDGGTGNDTLSGGDGDDVYFVDATGDVMNPDNSGFDRVFSSANTTLGDGIENLTLTGTAVIGIGNGGENWIKGNAVANVLSSNNPGTGVDDTFEGGLGNDTYRAKDGDLVIENAGEGTDLVLAINSVTSLWDNVENLTLLGHYVGTGNALNNVITGSSTLPGGDTIDGLGGNDTLIGGIGNDLIYVDTAGDSVSGGAGNDTVSSSVSLTMAATADFEVLALSGSANINASGNAGNNTLAGNSGDNYLFGGAGADSLDGAGGLFDVADYAGGATAITANLGTNSAAGDTLANIEGVRGTALADTLTGAGAGSFVDYSNALAGVNVNLATNSVSGGGGLDVIANFGGVRGSASDDTLTGTVGNDFFFADDGDAINGGGGIDTVYANTSFTLGEGLTNLTLIGAANLDATGNAAGNLITGNTGDNYLFGGAGHDSLAGGEGLDVADYFGGGPVTVDLLAGTATGAGDDLIGADIEGVQGSTGADSLTGGSNDLVDYSDYLSAVIVDLSTDSGSGDDTIIGFGGIRGSNNVIGDSMTGDESSNYFYVTTSDIVTGGGGADTIYSAVNFTLPGDVEALVLTGNQNITGTGNEFANLISGNSGNNTLTGGDSNDTLDGGAGTDSLVGGDGDDLYIVDAVGDQVAADSNGTADAVNAGVSFTLGGGLENLTLTGTGNFIGTGNSGNNSITGNAGNNTLDGGAGNDTLAGGAGNDTFIVDSSLDQATDIGGLDLVLAGASFVMGEGLDNLTLTGIGNIDGTGNILANLITGNAGNNALDGGAGNDTLVGGAGNDTYTVDSLGDVVTELATGGIDTLRASFSTTLVATIENLLLLGGEGLVGNGNAVANLIVGTIANDTLSGGGGNDGNDTLDGGAGGNDLLSGGVGNDFYVVDSANDTLVEAAGAGTDTVQAKINWTLTDNFENLASATAGDWTGNGNAAVNVITGGAGNDSLFGNAGADTLNGGLGNDTLDGGLGIDSMAGGAGDDTYIIEIATDKVAESLNQGIDTLVTPFTTVLAANFENLTLVGTAAVNGTGTADANTLIGNIGNNTLAGLGGDDSLFGGDGNDTLDGGLGNDTLAGGIGNDRFIFDNAGDVALESFNQGTDTVVAGFSYSLQADIENLELTGTGNFTGTGNELGNRISGNTGSNTLTGGDGHDTLDGGAGNDLLAGGIGNDVLVWDVNDAPLDGGAGNDAVKLAGAAQTLNLVTLAPGRLQSIERIDVGGTGNNNTLTFDFDQVRDLSNDSNTLYIDGDLFDVVNSLHPSTVEGAPHWELLGVEAVGDIYYIEYQYVYPGEGGDILTLFVNQDLTQNIS